MMNDNDDVLDDGIDYTWQDVAMHALNWVGILILCGMLAYCAGAFS